MPPLFPRLAAGVLAAALLAFLALPFPSAGQEKPDDPVALFKLGVAHYEAGRLDEAIAAFRKALQLKPDFPPAHFNLGVALREKGDQEGAARAFGEAQRLDPRLKPPPLPKKP